MNKKQIKILIFILFMISIITIPEMASATKYVICGNERKFPYAIVNLISKFMLLVKIVVPILLVVSGMISFFKVTISSHVEEDMKKAQSKLINSIIAAVVIFFVISIVNFAVGLVAGANNQFMSCINCFINPDACETKEITDDELSPGIIQDTGGESNGTESSENNDENDTRGGMSGTF